MNRKREHQNTSTKHANRSIIQPKLKIGAPNDRYEKEADHVADQVVKNPGTTPPMLQRMVTQQTDMAPLQRMEEEEGAQLQMKPADIQPATEGMGTAPGDISNQLSRRKGQGQPLPENVSHEMSSKIGADFSGVRVHTDGEAVQMNQDLGAKAFAHGGDVYFNKGAYNPGTSEGKHLLAHELTHTVQQGASKPDISMTGDDEPQMVPYNRLWVKTENPEVLNTSSLQEDLGLLIRYATFSYTSDAANVSIGNKLNLMQTNSYALAADNISLPKKEAGELALNIGFIPVDQVVTVQAPGGLAPAMQEDALNWVKNGTIKSGDPGTIASKVQEMLWSNYSGSLGGYSKNDIIVAVNPRQGNVQTLKVSDKGSAKSDESTNFKKVRRAKDFRAKISNIRAERVETASTTTGTTTTDSNTEGTSAELRSDVANTETNSSSTAVTNGTTSSNSVGGTVTGSRTDGSNSSATVGENNSATVGSNTSSTVGSSATGTKGKSGSTTDTVSGSINYTSENSTSITWTTSMENSTTLETMWKAGGKANIGDLLGFIPGLGKIAGKVLSLLVDMEVNFEVSGGGSNTFTFSGSRSSTETIRKALALELGYSHSTTSGWSESFSTTVNSSVTTGSNASVTAGNSASLTDGRSTSSTASGSISSNRTTGSNNSTTNTTGNSSGTTTSSGATVGNTSSNTQGKGTSQSTSTKVYTYVINGADMTVDVKNRPRKTIRKLRKAEKENE